jgi:hypothetical protein
MDIVEKSEKRQLMSKFRDDNLKNNSTIIDYFSDLYKDDSEKECDLLHGRIYVHFCETSYEKKKWKAYVLMTSSFPWKGAVGRQIKAFVMCDSVPLGMIHLTSPLAQLRVRDSYLNFTDKWKELQSYYNVECCMSMPKYKNMLTGKLLVYAIFSQYVYQYIRGKYNSPVLGFEITSLYGKSSIYNRIPFLRYLGLTDGLSAIYITDEEWKVLLEDYKTKFPKPKGNRLAPVKFQIVDKLNKWYSSRGIEFPYHYSDIMFRRGVYLGMVEDHNVSLDDSVTEWRNRWLIGRMERMA